MTADHNERYTTASENSTTRHAYACKAGGQGKKDYEAGGGPGPRIRVADRRRRDVSQTGTSWRERFWKQIQSSRLRTPCSQPSAARPAFRVKGDVVPEVGRDASRFESSVLVYKLIVPSSSQGTQCFIRFGILPTNRFSYGAQTSTKHPCLTPFSILVLRRQRQSLSVLLVVSNAIGCFSETLDPRISSNSGVRYRCSLHYCAFPNAESDCCDGINERSTGTHTMSAAWLDSNGGEVPCRC